MKKRIHSSGGGHNYFSQVRVTYGTVHLLRMAHILFSIGSLGEFLVDVYILVYDNCSRDNVKGITFHKFCQILNNNKIKLFSIVFEHLMEHCKISNYIYYISKIIYCKILIVAKM